MQDRTGKNSVIGVSYLGVVGCCSPSSLWPLSRVVRRYEKKIWEGGGGSPDRLVAESEYVKVQEDGSDAWRCTDITDLLRRGGVGVLPTDTGYGFVTPIDSKAGLERILKIKGYEGCKKPLSLLVPDLATIDTYCLGINKSTFKLLKKNLPGPYTFILPASSNLPKMMFLDSKGKKHSWDRKSLGVRIPEDQVLHYVQEELGGLRYWYHPCRTQTRMTNTKEGPRALHS